MSDVKIEFGDYVETRPAVETPDGTELVPVVKDGLPSKMTVQQIADFGGSGTGVTDGSKTGVLVSESGSKWIPTDHAFQVINTGSTDITLTFADKERGYFAGSASFGVNKNILFTGDDRATQFDFMFEVTVADITLDFGDDTRSTSANFVDGVFTAQDIGLHKVHGTRYGPGGLWILDFKGVYSVGDAPPLPTDQWILTTGIWNNSEYWDNLAIWRDTP